MPNYNIDTSVLTSEQQLQAIDLIQKIEALNSEINKLQILRRDAQIKYLEGFVDEWTAKEQFIAEERNKCVEAFKSIRTVDIKAG